MNNRNSICIVDDPDFKWHSIRGWSDEYCDVRIVGLESSPVVSKCVEHVVIEGTPCLRALAPMSTCSEYGLDQQPSTSIDEDAIH